MTKKPDKLSYNLRQGAEVIGVSVPTLSKMLKEGVIKHRRYGKRIFISREAIENFLREAA